jgi:hypothetical protein
MAAVESAVWHAGSASGVAFLVAESVASVVSTLPARRFAMYNVVGALIWTVLFCGAGYFFGNLPVVQHNFTLVVLGIVAVSVLPVVLEVRGCLVCVCVCLTVQTVACMQRS